ncbi:MAG: alpha-amylase [Bacteroidales bacterium]|nr:alpha-amylase [Bacteroidales bacterium]
MEKNILILLKIFSFLVITGLIVFIACNQLKKKKYLPERGIEVVKHPEWSKNAIIYEVNLRQFTPEGTFNAFAEHLPRLKELGVDILWLMPVFPIGELNRKATQTLLTSEIENKTEQKKYLGSAYSIKNFLSVNPEHGTMEDFKSLVNKIHELGMYVILDIAINHTAWDHGWVKTHPEYYIRIEKDSTPWNQEWMKKHPDYYSLLKKLGMTYPIHPNETDWWDTAELNFDNNDLHNELKNIFKYWVSETDIDGYRCDVAHGVPIDFWNELKPVLDEIKPVFMLAEAEGNQYHKKAFDMTYAWELHHLMNAVAQGKKKPKVIDKYFAKEDSFYLKNDIRMQFTSNHDENAWNGTVFERLGDAAEVFAVFTYIIPGMPLIYSGQEAGLNKKLRFFEKDTIKWKGHEFGMLYYKLNKLKKDNEALWNGEFGGETERIKTSADSTIFTIIREKDNNRILGIFNLSNKEKSFSLKEGNFSGNYQDAFSGEFIRIDKKNKMTLDPWKYIILIKK